MASISQWDTRWFDQFKSTFPSNLSLLKIMPGDPLAWVNKVNVPFGNKQAQRGVRNPDQDIQIAKEVAYRDKYASRLVQNTDMPALFDSLRIKEEYYAGDVVNAVGHVSDLFENFNDGLAQFVYVGTANDPLAYGLIDQGAGTGTTTVTRPDILPDITTAGVWETPAHYMADISAMESSLVAAGFHGNKAMILPNIIRPYLNSVLTSTTSPYTMWTQSIAGIPIIFTEWIDADATENAFDAYMVDTAGFDLYMNPLKVRGFFDNNTEDFVWHWKTRAALLAKPKWNGTDYQKGIVRVDAINFMT